MDEAKMPEGGTIREQVRDFREAILESLEYQGRSIQALSSANDITRKAMLAINLLEQHDIDGARAVVAEMSRVVNENPPVKR